MMVVFYALVLIAFCSAVACIVRAHTLSVRADRLADTVRAALTPDADDAHGEPEAVAAVDEIIANDEAVWVKAAEDYAARDDNSDRWRDVQALFDERDTRRHQVEANLGDNARQSAMFARFLGDWGVDELVAIQRLIDHEVRP